MALYLYSIEDKIEVLDEEVQCARRQDRPPGSIAQHQYEVLKAILADLKARAILPRSQPLGELERALVRVKKSKGADGYDEGQMIALANSLINKWPFVRQALEAYGEETAE